MQYAYFRPDHDHTHGYLWPAIEREIYAHRWSDRRAFDLGCGNGHTCRSLMALGFETTAVDPSESGVAIARGHGVGAHVGSAYDDLVTQYGTFPLVISLEVIEHLYDPRAFVRTFLNLIAPGGFGILSTPYHGYWKNLALAVSGKMEAHYTALWDGGHIKFFSQATLTRLFKEAGAEISVRRVGRVPPLAKSMIAIVAR